LCRADWPWDIVSRLPTLLVAGDRKKKETGTPEPEAAAVQGCRGENEQGNAHATFQSNRRRGREAAGKPENRRIAFGIGRSSLSC
jgi:hypothetical protein